MSESMGTLTLYYMDEKDYIGITYVMALNLITFVINAIKLPLMLKKIT